jgi:hypothetical protein
MASLIMEQRQMGVVNMAQTVRIKKAEDPRFFPVKEQVLLGANTPQKKLKEALLDIKARQVPVPVLAVLENNRWTS